MAAQPHQPPEIEGSAPGPRQATGGRGERIAWMLGAALFTTFCASILTVVSFWYLWEVSKTEDVGMSGLLVLWQAVFTIPIGYIGSVLFVGFKARKRDKVAFNHIAKWTGIGCLLPLVGVAAAIAVAAIVDQSTPEPQTFSQEAQEPLDIVTAELPEAFSSAIFSNWQGQGLGDCSLAYSEVIAHARDNTGVRSNFVRIEELLTNQGFTTARFSTEATMPVIILVGLRDNQLVEFWVDPIKLRPSGDVEGITMSSYAGACVEWQGPKYLDNPPTPFDSLVSGWPDEPEPEPEEPDNEANPEPEPEPETVDLATEIFELTDPQGWWSTEDQTFYKPSVSNICPNSPVGEAKRHSHTSIDPEPHLQWYLQLENELGQNGFEVRAYRHRLDQREDGESPQRWTIWAVKEDHAVHLESLFSSTTASGGMVVFTARQVFFGPCIEEGGIDLATEFMYYDESQQLPPSTEIPDLTE